MKQKVTPFLSVLLALSFLMPAALFAKPIKAHAAQFSVSPTYVMVSDDNASAIAWIFSLFARIVSTISSNDLLLYPVLLCMVIAAVTLAIRIVRKFGMKSRRS